jgi:cell division protease FtsH
MTEAGEREHTAYHEAGHALAAALLDLPRYDVSIVPGPDNLGHAHIMNPLREWERGDGPRRPALERFCIALFSGHAGELVGLGSATEGDWQDRDTVRYAIQESSLRVRGASFVGDEMWEAYERRLEGRSIVLIRRHHQGLHRLAKALLERETLTFEEVNDLAQGERLSQNGPRAVASRP